MPLLGLMFSYLRCYCCGSCLQSLTTPQPPLPPIPSPSDPHSYNDFNIPPIPYALARAQQESAPPPPAPPPLQSHGFGAVVQAPISSLSTTAVQRGPPTTNVRQHDPPDHEFANLPRTRPVFGVPLEALLIRDECSIPTIVCQCIQAVDLYGLDVEGIYRLSGEKKFIDRIKAIFDNDATCLDFRRPEDFFNDVNSAASVLKQYLRELPEPLLTNALYHEFLDAAREFLHLPVLNDLTPPLPPLRRDRR